MQPPPASRLLVLNRCGRPVLRNDFNPQLRNAVRAAGLDERLLTAYSVTSLGLHHIASVRVTTTGSQQNGSEGRTVLRTRLFDSAPVYLPTGAEARAHLLDITADLADTDDWGTRTHYVTVVSSPAADADWGFSRPLAAGEPARYTLIEKPPAPRHQAASPSPCSP